MRKIKTIVTGACGFIGSHMVEVLAEAGYQVIATDLLHAWEKPEPRKRVCVEAVKSAGAEFIPSDLTKPYMLEKLPADVSYIFHAASVFSYKAPWKLLYEVNVLGTMNLVEYAKKCKDLKRFVLWGAGGIYGLPERQKLPLVEDVSLPDPSNNYLRSKFQQEFFIMRCGNKDDFPYTIIRPTTVYGPRGYYGGGQMLMALASSSILAVPRNFTGRIPFVHVADVARAALHLALHQEAEKEVYNVNDDSTMTMVEFFRFMAELMGHKLILLPTINHLILRKILKGVGYLENFITRDILKIGPFLEPDSFDYLNGDFLYSNEKLKSTGFKFLYPDARIGIQETIQWFIHTGWMKKPRLNLLGRVGLEPAPKPK